MCSLTSQGLASAGPRAQGLSRCSFPPAFLGFPELPTWGRGASFLVSGFAPRLRPLTPAESGSVAPLSHRGCLPFVDLVSFCIREVGRCALPVVFYSWSRGLDMEMSNDGNAGPALHMSVCLAAPLAESAWPSCSTGSSCARTARPVTRHTEPRWPGRGQSQPLQHRNRNARFHSRRGGG